MKLRYAIVYWHQCNGGKVYDFTDRCKRCGSKASGWIEVGRKPERLKKLRSVRQTYGLRAAWGYAWSRSWL